MSETIEYIKKFNIGDRVTSTNTILLDRGFRGVSGIIKSIVKDNFDSWQYLIQLDDGRELQCDDWHLEQQKLGDDQQIVLDWLKEYYTSSQWTFPFYVIKHAPDEMPEDIFTLYDALTKKEQFEILTEFALWGQEQGEDYE